MSLTEWDLLDRIRVSTAPETSIVISGRDETRSYRAAAMSRLKSLLKSLLTMHKDNESSKAEAGSRWWMPHFRDWSDEDEPKWWFAGTGIPLLAATIGPLANVLSIAALVTSWRMCVVNGAAQPHRCNYNGDSSTLIPQLDGREYADPQWILNLNIVSLIVGFIGNFFLLCNFTNRIRYSIALPVTIVCWYVATGLLIGATGGMQIWHSPVRPQQTYTQGFWYVERGKPTQRSFSR